MVKWKMINVMVLAKKFGPIKISMKVTINMDSKMGMEFSIQLMALNTSDNSKMILCMAKGNKNGIMAEVTKVDGI